MRKLILAAAVAGAALTLTACSEETTDTVDEAAEGAMADVETNADAMAAEGEALVDDGAAMVDEGASMVEEAADDATDAAAEVTE